LKFQLQNISLARVAIFDKAGDALFASVTFARHIPVWIRSMFLRQLRTGFGGNSVIDISNTKKAAALGSVQKPARKSDLLQARGSCKPV
jgi:hypothetical protein